MKKLFLVLALLGMTISSNAQVVKSEYDLLQDRRTEVVQLKLKKMHDQYFRGAALWYLGAAITAISIPNMADNGPGGVYAGVGLNLLGTVIMIASHKQLREAYKVGNTVPIDFYLKQ
jgi:ABC-type cobalamin transport system permease subunit